MEQNSDNESQVVTDSVEFTEIISRSVSANYMVCGVEGLFDSSHCVVVGEYKENLNTYFDTSGMPVSNGVFKVKEVLKGEYTSDEITVNYEGGIVPLYDVIKDLTVEQRSKYYGDISDEEAKTIGYKHVSVGSEECNFESGKEYLLTLACNSATGEYFYLCDDNGSMEITQEGIYDVNDDSYVQLEQLRQRG